MADNPYVNKVVYNNSTLIDLSGDTVTPESLISGYTAHDRSGAPINGSAVIPTKISDLQDDVGYLVENDVVNDFTNNDATKVASQKEAYDLYAMLAHSVYASSDVFTAQSGGTIKANYSFATKMANVCYLQLNVTAASSGSLVTVAELKSGFVPYNKNIYTMAIDESDNSTREVNINANNGQIGIYGAVSGHTYNISVAYIT